jgi:predicted Zn-dependent peptidase
VSVTLAQQYRIGDIDGIRLVTERVPSVRSVSLGVWIPTGSRDELDSQRGYAHFVEHLIFKGSDTRDAAAISRFFDRIGSDANAATTKEYTMVHTRVLARHLADTLEVLGDMVWSPRFDPDDVESERQVILEEIAMYADSPSDVVHDVADELLFAGHPLGLPIVGTAASIEPALATEVAAFHTQHYRPGRIVVSAAGDLDHDELTELVRTRFLPDPQRPRPRAAAQPTVARTVPTPVRAARVVGKDAEQVHLCLSWLGISRSDERRGTAAVLDTVFGSTPGSRLFVEVRELRGLAYSVYSFQSQYSDSGQFGVYVGVRPDRVHETLEVVNAELERIRTQPLTAEELERAKDHLEGRALLSMESTGVRGNRLGSALVAGLPIESVESMIEKIRAVTAADVQELAADLLDPAGMAFAAVAEDPDPVAELARTQLGVSDAMFAAVPAAPAGAHP